MRRTLELNEQSLQSEYKELKLIWQRNYLWHSTMSWTCLNTHRCLL